MAHHVHKFLRAVLGDDAAAALRKAADRSEALSSVLGARAIVGWLTLASRWNYEGEVPGFEGSYFRFAKSETNAFDGEVRLGKNQYEFKGVDLPHVAAGLSVALGADQMPDEDLRDAELVALGQNIDLLLKTQVLKSMTKAEDSDCECSHCEMSGCSCECHDRPALDKAAGTTAPGEAATQKPPAGPVGGGFTAPKAKAPNRQKSKGFGAKLNMSQATSKCSVCGEAQFCGDIFKGCACLRDLAKHASAEATVDGFKVTFDPEYWTKDDVSVLLDIVSEGA